MSVKNVCLIALVLLNLLLVTAVVLVWTAPPTAMAQAGPGGGRNYAVVTAKMEAGEDAVWILDLAHKDRLLHVYRLPQNAAEKQLKHVGTRDLVADMRKGG